MLSRFHRIPERDGQTDAQTDGQTELLYQYRVSVMTRDKHGNENYNRTFDANENFWLLRH